MEQDDKRQFGAFISTLREEWGVTLEQLCEGLCSPSHLAKLEKGERETERLLQGRLLSRLGVSPDEYENLLDAEEYIRWRKRHGILRSIILRKSDVTEDLLEQYRQEYDMEDPLERQFYLTMSAQQKWNVGDREELADLYGEALRLTVPQYGRKSLRQMVLSIQELNLILECERHSGRQDAKQRYEEVLNYIEQSRLDSLSKAKLYPKTVFYLWESVKEQQDGQKTGQQFSLTEGGRDCISEAKYRQMLKWCDKAIEMLRDTMRLYYMWEMLDTRQDILERLAKQNTSFSDPQQEESQWFARRMAEQQERIQWKSAMEALYAEYDIPVTMYEFCYLYEEQEIYCIGDVIRIRREMLGLTRTQLSEGICSCRTLRRLERHETKPQRPIVRDLLHRLNLPAEYCRTELATENPEAKRLMKELRCYSNMQDYRRADELTERIKEMIPMNNVFNRQVMARYDLLHAKKRKALSSEEYVRRMTDTLEMTLPLQAAFCDKEKYMTNEELLCIQNLILFSDIDSTLTKKCIRLLIDFYRQYEDLELEGLYISMYETVMNAIASVLGNMGKYNSSDEISQNMIGESLYSRRMIMIHDSIYNIFWNCEQRQKEMIPLSEKRDQKMALEQCVVWSKFTKDQKDYTFYIEKLKRIRENDTIV